MDVFEGRATVSRMWRDARSGKAFQYCETVANSLYFARLHFRSGFLSMSLHICFAHTDCAMGTFSPRTDK